MTPFMLPWTFFMLDSGVRNFRSKINTAGYMVIFFIGFVFPIYYFFDLLQEREDKLIQERNKRKKD